MPARLTNSLHLTYIHNVIFLLRKVSSIFTICGIDFDGEYKGHYTFGNIFFNTILRSYGGSI